MATGSSGDLSVTMTSFFMKCVGFWLAADPREQMFRDGAFCYTIGAIFFAVFVETLDFYYSWGNFADVAYITCNIMALVTVLYKMFLLAMRRKDFLNLIRYTQTNFWHSNYDEYCSEIMTLCKKKCTLFVGAFTFCSQMTVCCYIITPLVENIGRNESDRVLPFTMWIDFPFTLSPYYEITYVVQILSLYHVGICYACFDNFLCILNTHTAGQFRMLQYQLSTLCGLEDPNEYLVADRDVNLIRDTTKSQENLKHCIQRHQELLNYTKNVEDIFTFTILGQVLLFSLVICLTVYQVVLADSPSTRRVLFTVYIIGTFFQLLMFTFSCDELIEDSGKIANGAYSAYWYSLPNDRFGNNFRKDVMIIIARAQKLSCLTAGGFFPISLETTTTILSTAMSYFTLLRQRSIDVVSD